MNSNLVDKLRQILNLQAGRVITNVGQTIVPVVVGNDGKYPIPTGFPKLDINQTYVSAPIVDDPTGASPASQQAYTVPTGKKFYCWVGNVSCANIMNVKVRDAVADGGTTILAARLAANGTETWNGISVFSNGVRIDAADIPANSSLYATFIGWIE